MVGIDPKVITHKLNVDPSHRPVQQKRRKFAPERNAIINEEVDKLIETGKIREVNYPEWLSNVVVVRKKNGKWRVCIDFTDLNKACPKDPFPLPHIDAMVDATSGHEMLTFLDAWSGYNQIQMHPDDQEKTSFRSERGVYCYNVMPFGLKNAGATYQRLVNKMFKNQIGDTMEVYIDDMVVKSLQAKQHVQHLQDTFDTLRKYKMKLNPTKCSFGVSSGKFLGHVVTQRGIEASPEQIRAIINLEAPKCVKDVQKLTGRVAALNRFISKSSDKCRLFYDTLRKNKSFQWTDEHNEAFNSLKEYLSTPPLLSKPLSGESLYLYLSVTESAVSAVLVREQEKTQLPIYYVSKTLLDAETRYTSLEKLVLALIIASQKLRPYFESHTIVVRTNYPMKAVMKKPDLSGRMAKWSIHLSSYNINYEPRTAIKSQALADFVVDFNPSLQTEADKEVLHLDNDKPSKTWILNTDGASNMRGTGVGLVLKSPQGDTIVQAVRCEFKATNNEAEYEALILGLSLALDMKIRQLEVCCDSQLIVNHLNESYAARDSKMIAYLEVANSLKRQFAKFSIRQVPRDLNVEADALATLGATFKPTTTANIPIIHILKPSIDKSELVSTVENEQTDPLDWTTPYLEWLRDDKLPTDKNEVRSFKIKASRFLLIDNVLFRRSAAGPYLRCLDKHNANKVLQELHDGVCGNHTGGRSLSNKARRMGYYWPTMNQDAKEYVRKCDACQRHAFVMHQPAEPLHPIISPWPFMKWGMDIVGKLPTATGQRVFMLAMTDYFSKWIEAEAYSQVTDKQVISFIKRNILCRYGIPSEIICDNGSQFISNKTEAFCAKWNITLRKSAPRNPKTNGQAESSNKIIIENLKKKLEEKAGKWADELPLVLWADRTTPKTATGQTPFSLVYGSEAVIPVEVCVPTHRYGCMTDDRNDIELAHNLDTVDELRDEAKIRIASYKQMVAKSYNKNVRVRTFQEGDLVLRKVFQNTQNHAAGKFAFNWEGPYQIESVVGQGAYRLMNMEGKLIDKPWNVLHLKRYYV